MKNSVKSNITLFIGVIFLASVSMSTNLLDYTLTPRFCTLAVGLFFTFYFLYRSGYTQTIQLDQSLLLYFSYTVMVCISLTWATTKSESCFESAKQVLFFFTFLFTVYSLKKDPEHFYKLISKISLILFLIALSFGFFQFLTLKEVNKEALYAITGINGHKNLFSSFLFLNLFFLLRGALKSQGVYKLLFYLSIVCSLLIISFLRTKAVWLGLGLCCFVFIAVTLLHTFVKNVVLKINTILIISVIAVLLNLFFLVYFQPLLSKSINYTALLNTETNTQAKSIKLEEERLILWDKTLSLVKKHPLLGVGSGNWQVNFPDASLSGLWRAEDLNYTFQRPHNDFLWILSETGLIGFNLFLFFLLVMLSYLVRLLLRIKNNKKQFFEVLLCFVFILGFYTISFFDFPKERIEHSLWINILLGIAYVHLQSGAELKSRFSFQLKSSHILVALLILVGICGIGLLRFQGEYYTRKMLDNKNNNRKLELIKTGEKALSFAYSIDPTSVPLHWYMGNAQAALGNYTEAKRDFILAESYAPFNRNVLNDLASAYAMTNDNAQAKKYYKEAARISPRFDDPKLNLAAIYIQENNFKEAEACLKSLFHDSERRTEYERILREK